MYMDEDEMRPEFDDLKMIGIFTFVAGIMSVIIGIVTLLFHVFKIN